MKRWTFVVVAVMLFLLVACGSGGTVSVASAWGRVSPMNAENGAFYMQLVNEGDEDDALVSATAELCGTVELHESYMAEDGTMAMRPVEGGKVPVPAGETVELKVGGLHVMCLGVGEGFAVGQTVPVTLEFEKAGTIAVDVEIREDAP
ncbi:MAG: copper chaperone PCu(A)C [Chloroflexi bacterium]|nr:copper chaperone PCu(A)C [Chloroflexota bacterium]MBP8056765.1 copper chaperone PCu(A)C [Chloroflexota bacterium]